MKKRSNTYREVTKLPERALTVSEYADSKNIDHSYVYKQWRRHIIDGRGVDFEIVLFKTMNYVIPKIVKLAKT